jgi:aminoglycoside/choline kinase family phosphotransferase
MELVIERLKSLYHSYNGSDNIIDIVQLPQSGGDRIYFRLFTKTSSYIATFNSNIKENETFLKFTEHFKKMNCPLPSIYAVNKEGTIYIQQDFGNESLLNKIEAEGLSENVYSLFRKSLEALANMQINGDRGLDYNWCITSKEFGKQAILSDLLYFKYYFLDTLKIPYDKEALINDFEQVSTYLSEAAYKGFMFRDFQSRNIMISNGEPHFIDYQGGMKGALQYDVASLLWQAKAELTDEWKNSLLEYYMGCAEAILGKTIDRPVFINRYNGYVLIRLLQVLGAYGFRGIFERKAHFLTSIPLALSNLKWFLSNKNIGLDLTEFNRVLSLVVADDIVRKFIPVHADKSTPLIVKVNSFSYKIGGIPVDTTSNGGGFVFDCRGILNPGRFDEYKSITGRDKPVIDFLEQRTKMPEFLNSIYNVVDIVVENYIERGFDSLMVSFGCTGGCHRSVYAAEQLIRHLRNKYGVKVELHHIEQHIKEKRGF